MNFVEQRMKDLLRTCYHEAGHLVALSQFGGYGCIEITENPNGNQVDERYFSGRIQIYNLKGDKRIIGLAGLVAELLLEDLNEIPGTFDDAILMDVMTLSETDAELAEGYSYSDIEVTFELLHKNWREVKQIAESEIAIWV